MTKLKEYVFKLKRPVETGTSLGEAGSVVVHQCPECFSLVVEDFMPDHERWHFHQKQVEGLATGEQPDPTKESESRVDLSADGDPSTTKAVLPGDRDTRPDLSWQDGSRD